MKRALLIALFLATDIQAAIYDVIDLGTLGGTSSVARAINDRGVVVGEAQWTNGEIHAFIVSNGVMTRLLTAAYVTNSAAYDINQAGHVVGLANTTGGMRQAFYDGVVLTNLGVFDGGNFSIARGVNASNVVAGQAHITNTFGTVPHAFVWTNASIVDLGTFDGAFSSEAYDINDDGIAVGFSYRFCPGDCYHPFVWAGGTLIDLGTLGGDIGQAYGINRSGQVVGSSARDWYYVWHAFLVTPQGGQWDDDNEYGTITNSFMVDLGTLGGTNSYARAINDAGSVVGMSETLAAVPHAFIHEGGLMMDLNDLIPTNSGWVLSDATAINNSGQIVGVGTVSGQVHAFLLTAPSNQVLLIDGAYNSGTSELTFRWLGRGSNLGFSVEMAENTTSPLWQAVPPTSQWPLFGVSWACPPALVASGSLFRIRAASY